MCLQFLVWLLITSSFFPAAIVGGQDVEEQPDTIIDPDMYAQWTELVYLPSPAHITDEIQETPSHLLGTHSMADSDGVDPEAQLPDAKSELIPKSLEMLLFEEIGNIIQSLETMINSTVSMGTVFHDILASTSSDGILSNGTSFTPLLRMVAKFVVLARDDFRAKFPLPATAPGHADRVKHVSEALERLQRLAIHLASDYGIEHEVIKDHLVRVKPFLRDMVVFIGDVAELHPSALEALVLNLSAMLLPEAVYLRSLVILYCFGPYVLGKDAINEWLLKRVSETLRL